MFRNCFDQALQFHGVDPSGVHVINKLNFSQSEAWNGTIVRKDSADLLEMWPGTRIRLEHNRVLQIENGRSVIRTEAVSLGNIAYWNKDSLVFLDRR